jgi:hypothetical protein
MDHMDKVKPDWRLLSWVLPQPLGIYLFGKYLTGNRGPKFIFVKKVHSYRDSHPASRRTMAEKMLQFIDEQGTLNCYPQTHIEEIK